MVRISSGVKEFLTIIFDKGAKDLHQNAMPAAVVEQIKKRFPVSDWVEVQTVKGGHLSAGFAAKETSS